MYIYYASVKCIKIIKKLLNFINLIFEIQSISMSKKIFEYDFDKSIKSN